MTFRDALAAIDSHPVYGVALVFYGLYPITMAIMWITMSIVYFRRREVNTPDLAPPDYLPFVSIVIPAFEEEHTIARTLDAALAVDYPDFEVVVVNDGSGDGTAEVVLSYAPSGRVRLVNKRVNEGKAMALNDAIPACRGEILLCLDGDIVASPSILRSIVPHFASPRVGAVTGNPRVANRGSLLRDLQALEFSSIISVQRRAQRIWGRVLTVSGAVMALRKSALLEVGGFEPAMATEDIDLTWKMQRAFWDVRYEPTAVVWMQVPPTLRELWKQRRRWARGLAQVLKAHGSCVLRWKQRRLWPVFGEALLSVVWAYTFVLMTMYWIVSAMVGYAPLGSSPIPNLWGMLIATACLTQLLTGALMEKRYDPQLMRHFPVAIFYPIVYWMLMSIITSIYTVDALARRPPQMQRWKIRRVAVCLVPWLLLAPVRPAHAQSAAELVERGHEAARASRHREAIDAYERALALEPGLRAELLPRLGRQYLWSDRAEAAARLLAEAVRTSADCELRNDYGLALSWSEQLSDAANVLGDVIATCPAERSTARLRLALVRRWQDRPSAAEALYVAVLDSPDSTAARAAEGGLAYVALMRDYNRSALAKFRTLEGRDSTVALEGQALALARLGEYSGAAEMLTRLRTRGTSQSRDMRDLSEAIELRDAPHGESSVIVFRDADGTHYTAGEGSASIGWSQRGRAAAFFTTLRLTGADHFTAHALGIDAEHRWSPIWAARLDLRAVRWKEPVWTPITGELNIVFTPSDRIRMDAALARVTVNDNVAAVANQLTGAFLSASMDWRANAAVTLVAGADYTDWSAGAHRIRLRGGPRWQLEGRPRLTFEWPTLVQLYDEPLPFAFFSPERYVETGPSVNAYLRFDRVWNVSAYARLGVQSETMDAWNRMGTVRAAVWRDLADHWSLRTFVGWSDSNIASSGGFRRSSLGLDLVRQF